MDKKEFFDLKAFREAILKMTQKELADLLKIRQDTLSRYESDPKSIPLGFMGDLMEKTGSSFHQLMRFRKIAQVPLDVKNNWSSINYIKNTLEDYLAEFKAEMEGTEFEYAVKNMRTAVAKVTGKPRLVVLGRSDAGKSTMINNLIGAEKLPRDWSPTTSIAVYLKHIQDRPEYIKDDVWVFKNDPEGREWDDRRLMDEEYTTSLKIASGEASILYSYGTSEGEAYQARKELEEDISAAVLFLDSPILRTCDIIDVPGFTGGRPSDVKAAERAATRADILIYLSQANSFMGMDDFTYLKGGIEHLAVIDHMSVPLMMPRLANLFVVASQAHIVDGGDPEKIQKCLDRGAERFFDTLTDQFWQSKSEISGFTYTQKDLRQRFFPYTIDIAELRKDFEDQLKNILEAFPKIVENHVIDAICAQQNVVRAELEERLRRERLFRDDQEAVKEEYRAMNAEAPRVRFELEEKRAEILSEIQRCRETSKNAFMRRFNGLINETSLVDLMKQKGTENKKHSKEQFLAYLSTRLDDECKDVLWQEANRLQPKIEEYTESCQSIFNSIHTVSNEKYHQVISGLSAKRLFVSGLSGAATLGALSIWASTLGNLGGYIIVTKAVSLLATLGIHVGGTAAAVSTVSALGGPVAWGIGLAVIVAISAFAVLGGGWKKQLAKGICREMSKQDSIQEYTKTIDKQWKDTERAFNMGADAVILEWDKHLEELRQKAESALNEEVCERISQLEHALERIEGLPFCRKAEVFNV